MENLLNLLPELLSKMFAAVISSLSHNWLPLSLAILTAAVMKAHVDTEKLKQSLLKKPKVSILTSVAVGAFTPLCACGTMAVIIGLLTTSLPWGPVMAFLTSSPLMSPDGFILLAGVIGFRFAVVMAVASVAIGLGSGFVTHLIEKKTDFLKNQTRFKGRLQARACGCAGGGTSAAQNLGYPDVMTAVAQGCGCAGSEPAAVQTPACGCAVNEQAAVQFQPCGCAGWEASTKQLRQDGYAGINAAAAQGCGCAGEDKAGLQECGCTGTDETTGQGCCNASEPVPAFACGCAGTDFDARIERRGARKPVWTVPELLKRIKLKEMAEALWKVGIRQILLFYSMFVAIGYLINYFMPESVIMALFRPDSIFSVPLAALIGLPLYVTGESAIPLVQALLEGGAGEGSMMAFMITGPATSAWVIAGITTFMKRRAIILYVSYILAGAIIFGYLYDLFLAMGI